MVLSTADPLKQAGQWIRKPANMELAWSRYLGLTASVAAYSIADNEMNRAVLEIEGPGAEIYLSMETGIHRLHFPRTKDGKIRVEILPNKPPKYNFAVDIRSMKHRRGEFDMQLRCKGRFEISFNLSLPYQLLSFSHPSTLLPSVFPL